jgi:hypothetical protein
MKTSRSVFEKLDLDLQTRSKSKPIETEAERDYKEDAKHCYKGKEEEGRTSSLWFFLLRGEAF